jgi:hypothetical protein
VRGPVSSRCVQTRDKDTRWSAVALSDTHLRMLYRRSFLRRPRRRAVPLTVSAVILAGRATVSTRKGFPSTSSR